MRWRFQANLIIKCLHNSQKESWQNRLSLPSFWALVRLWDQLARLNQQKLTKTASLSWFLFSMVAVSSKKPKAKSPAKYFPIEQVHLWHNHDWIPPQVICKWTLLPSQKTHGQTAVSPVYTSPTPRVRQTQLFLLLSCLFSSHAAFGLVKNSLTALDMSCEWLPWSLFSFCCMLHTAVILIQ